MKDFIKLVMLALIAENGSATTLEIKNAVHEKNRENPIPGFELTQAETSQFVSEIYREAAGEITRDMHPAHYYVYSSTPAVVAGTNFGVGNVSTKKAPKIKTAGSRNPLYQPAALIGSNLPAYNSKGDEGLRYVAFDATNKSNVALFDTTNKYEARAGFKLFSPSVFHDDIRMMQLKNFVSRIS